MSNTPYTTPQADVTPDTNANADQRYKPKLFPMSGRIGRVRYLTYLFLTFLITFIPLTIIGNFFTVHTYSTSNETKGILSILLFCSIIIIFVAIVFLSWLLMMRRLNDMNMSGWFSLLILVPLINFLFSIAIILYPGTKGTNNYGPQQIKNSIWIWIGGLIVPVLIAGILAAAALPAYHDYSERVQRAEQQLLDRQK